LQIVCFSELLINTDKSTNIQKPPLYKHILPRVHETTTNNDYLNYSDNNIATKLPMSLLTKQITHPSMHNMPSDSIKERQSRVDRILEKYRRQPSNSCSRQFSRSFSCNAATETAPSTENNLLLQATMMVGSSGYEDNKTNSGPRSVSPYALFDRSDGTSATTTVTHQDCIKSNADNSLLSKSYSMKSLNDSRTQTLGSTPLSVDRRSISKFNSSSINNDEDPSSSSSSSSSTTTTTTATTSSKSLVPKKDNNNYQQCSPALLDWTVGNCSEETVSDRITRRSYYVKLK